PSRPSWLSRCAPTPTSPSWAGSCAVPSCSTWWRSPPRTTTPWSRRSAAPSRLRRRQRPRARRASRVHVVATAGHVDHGKSTLVDALTGMQSDRLEEERRRGLSIELGYVWTSLPEVGEVAFVDVPGHERFVSTMLAGI